MFNEYYKNELIALRQDGVNFSKKNPGLSFFLSKEGQDPDVERLLEGFAFLTGRLKQQLDQELPELSNTLVQLLWPNYARVVPSYSVIKYDAVKNGRENIVINKGTEVLSKLKPDTIQCKFKTVYETTIMPFELEKVNYSNFGQKSSLNLSFKTTNSSTLKDIKFESLRIFLNGSEFLSQDLYLFLMNYVENIEVILKNTENENISKIKIDKNSIKPVGFDSTEYMLPYSANIFEGYILLQEYFCFKDKFLFVDIHNLNLIEKINSDLLFQSNSFEVKIDLKKTFSFSDTLTKDNFLLYSTPIINLFNSDATPIRKTSTQEEYLVLTSEINREFSEIFQIEKVRGWSDKNKNYQDFLPFEYFAHSNDDNEHYSIKTKLSLDGTQTNIYVRFSNFSKDNLLSNMNSTISIKTLSTNKNLPSSLMTGDICVSSYSNAKDETPFKNITIPTRSYPAPIKGDFFWKIISNLSLNYLSLKDIKTLQKILEAYDFISIYDKKQKEKTKRILEGLIDIKFETMEFINQGLPIKGIHIKLKLDKNKFSSLGEAYIFSSVLNKFFALYNNINSFHKLSVDVINEDSFEWPIKMGNQYLI